MKKTIYLMLLSILFSFSVVAQQERNCKSMENLEYRKSQNPLLVKNMQKIEAYTQTKVQELQAQQNKIVGNIITIPVVVHVIYSNANENISDAQIQSQMDVLNEDFRRLNADADNTWSAAADMQIEFCMATVDPNGNATNGITRKSSSTTSWGTNDNMKRSSQGGVNPWDASQYLNMWVCNIGGGILGYAQFPGGSAATDGVVMSPQYFGSSAKGSGFFLSAPFDLGRTTTHEVGHFLNLRHIWGDGGCGVDDFVSDTPESDASNGGCSTSHVSCGTLDMVQNYMDYSDDACMNLFTVGQKNRMRATLLSGGSRAALGASDKCGAVAQPTCTDGVQNGTETGVDCGGSCTPCQTGNQYCASQGNSVADEYISRVQVATINNTSGAQSYSDFTSISTNLTKGSAYTLTVTPTWTGTVYSEGYAAWIDYNNDGDFLDAGEQVLSIAATQTTPVSGSFTVPASAATGNTRLRVAMKYNGVPTSCEAFSYGEVEDYTVNLGASAGDTQAPSTVTNLSISNITQTTLDLNWSAATDNVAVTGYDLFLNGSSTAFASVTSNSANITGLTASTTYSFRVKAKDAAGNSSGFSNTATGTTLGQTGGSGCTGGITAFPYSEGFETSFGAWTQGGGDDFNWARRSGTTPSSNTGPSSASEGSQYVYMESSAPNYAAKRSILVSPCFDLAGVQASFSFKYHMYGATSMGSLALEASTDNGTTWTSLWSRSGNQGNAWATATVDLSAYADSNMQLRFNGVTGSTWQGDMAVDDISLTDSAAPVDKCAGVSAYVSGASYAVGEQVTYQGYLYVRTSTGWTNLGACGTARDNSGTIPQFPGASHISLYPNPVKGDVLYIKSDAQNLPFTMVNMLGQQVKKGLTTANGVDVSELKAGLYMIQFQVNDIIETRKFVKK